MCVCVSIQYMEKEDAMNVLQFWLAAENFQDQLAAKKGQYDGQEAQNDAMILYDKYVLSQIQYNLWFGTLFQFSVRNGSRWSTNHLFAKLSYN